MKKAVEIRDLAERLGSLKERKWQLEGQIKDLEARLAKLAPGSSGGNNAVESKLLTIIDAEPEREFRVADLLPLVSAKPATLRAALARLKAATQIKSEERGLYRSNKLRQ